MSQIMPATHPAETISTTSVDYFENIYAKANGDVSSIPWADGAANPALVTWMNAIAPSLIRCGSRVAVVGCGLGEDTREIIRRGYEVTAFDCSQTAVNWSKQLDPANANCYHHADLFDLPARWRHRFELVLEVYTLQSISPSMRADAMRNIAELVAPHGRLLVICRGAEQSANENDGAGGPPWPLTEEELLHDASLAGLTPDGDVCSFMDDENPPVHRIRAAFKRA